MGVENLRSFGNEGDCNLVRDKGVLGVLVILVHGVCIYSFGL